MSSPRASRSVHSVEQQQSLRVLGQQIPHVIRLQTLALLQIAGLPAGRPTGTGWQPTPQKERVGGLVCGPPP